MRRRLAGVVAAALVVGAAAAMAPDLKVGPARADTTPGATFGPAPSESGADPTFRSGADVSASLAPAVDAASRLPRLHSLLVSWRGSLVLERYFNRRRATSLANIKSASKSVISALVGIAIARGEIPGVKAPIATYFPDSVAGAVADARRAITIEDLLTMRSGLETTSNRNYGAWVLSRNWVSHALSRPLVTDPGTRMVYSTGNTHLLSAILTKATDASTRRFAQDALAGPLGFTLADWPRDPQGVYFGGNDMLMTPRQMVAFGELYLNRGTRGGVEVVPAAWVDESFVARTESPRAGDRSYGYGWWIRDMAGYPAYYAWGYGGQFIFVLPDLELVVVTTSISDASPDRGGHNGRIYELVEAHIIPAIHN
jgi:CubicO group peptidase (beta-lactamase class C family)